MADGSIIFETALDNKQLEKDLAKINRRIQTLNNQVFVKGQQKIPLMEQSKKLAASLDEAKAKLFEMQSGRQYIPLEQIAEQEERVKMLQKEWDRVENAVDRYNKSIQSATSEIEAQKSMAGALQKEIASTSVDTEKMASATTKARKGAAGFATQLKYAMSSILLYGTLFQVYASFTDWLGRVIMSNREASAAVAQLKGALLTLAQPLLQIVIPAFVALVKVLTAVVSTIAQLFAWLTGTTIETAKDSAAALEEETGALEATGSAAEEAEKSLASFDEINKLSGDAAGGGAGGAAGGGISPDFGFESSLTESQLKNILGLIEAIGSAFLAWRIGKALGLGLKETLGLALAIYSAIQLVKNLFSAWTDGVNWDNLLGILLSTLGLVTGLYIAFGQVGAAIGLIVSGIAMLITGFKDAFTNGWNLQNLLLTIAGIMATGLGISILTGSFIPALIAAIASVILAFTVAAGNGEDLLLGIQTILEGFRDFFVGVFTGDIEKAIDGITKIFEGLNISVDAIFDGIEKTISSFLDWLNEKTHGVLDLEIEYAKDIFISALEIARESLHNFIEAIEQIFKGLITFLSGVFTQDWDKAWDGLVQIGKGALNLLVSMLESFVNFWINGINTMIKALNTISIDVPSWVPGVGGKHYGVNIPLIPKFSIPRLASGAVIPPNKEFLAVLGDQKNGTNVEAPLATIKQALIEALQSSGGMGGGTTTVVVQLDGKEVARNTVKHVNNMTRQAGKPVLLL